MLRSLALFLLLAFAPYVAAQTITALHYFTNTQDGEGPITGVAVDRAGNVFGTTTFGGDRSPICAPNGGCGVVYRANLKNGSWIFTPLYDFHGGDDGANPYSSVTIGPDGALYGTTLNGGGGGGIIYKLTPPPRLCHQVLCPWTETVLLRFADYPGLVSPFGGVTFDAAGNLYGFTAGAIYQLTRVAGTWSLNVLYTLRQDQDGVFPMWEPKLDAAGNIYGAAEFGGPNGNGTVFRLVRSGDQWSFEVLYDFPGGSNGSNPWGVAIPDSAGNVFGATGFNGGVFELTPSGGSWNYSVIEPFLGGLQESINLGPDGSLYGTNYADGSGGIGSIWKLSQTQDGWTRTVLHSFQGPDDGALPLSNVIFDPNGNMYGTTTMGGHYGFGTVWQLAP